VTESLPSNEPGTQKRRSTRIVQAIPITVSGTDALGQPFKERTTTVMVNCHGCKYQSKHYVPKNSMVKLEIPQPEAGSKPKVTEGRVVWVQRPRTVRELFQIGLEFEVPGNAWGIAFPPEDWAADALPVDYSVEPTVPFELASNIAGPEASISPQPLPPMPPPPMPPAPEIRLDATGAGPVIADAGTASSTSIPPNSLTTPAATPVSSVPARPAMTPPVVPAPLKASIPVPPPMTSAPVASVPSSIGSTGSTAGAVPPPPANNKIHVMPQAANDSQALMARQMSHLVAQAKEQLDKTLRSGAEAAVNEQVSAARKQLDSQLNAAVEKAIEASMQRVSDSALHRVVQQATERTSALVDEARRSTETSAAQLDEKVRDAVNSAVNSAVSSAVDQAAQQAAISAAQQAAQQTATQNLKLSVEEAVERALRERAASTPSLEILSSPEAAQNHLDQWQQSLEEKSQSIRGRAIEQANADAAAVSERFSAEFDTALNSAAQKLGSQLHDVTQESVTRAELEARNRAQALRDTLEETSKSVLSRAEQDATSKAEFLRSSLGEVIAGAAATIESLGSSLQVERNRAEEAKNQLHEASQSLLTQTRRDLDQLVASQREELGRVADQVIAERAQLIEPALEQATQKVLNRVSTEMEQKLGPGLDQVQQAVAQMKTAGEQAERTQAHIHEQIQAASEQLAGVQQTVQGQIAQASEQVEQMQTRVREQIEQSSISVKDLQNEVLEQIKIATDRTDQLQDTIRESAQQTSEQVVQDTLARLRSEAAKVPGELEQASRTVVAKIEEEFQQRATETQHATYDALLKASDWYQKKAQTTMQSTLEKVVEQSSTALRDRAAEVSSLLAAELDHYGRTYVEHSSAQIDDAAKEISSREREKMTENAQMATASFSDQVHRVTAESLSRFERASREALEKARSDMEFNREGSLAEYQKHLDTRMMESVEQAGVHLQSQLIPMMEQWDARREAEKKEWMERLQKSTDESIEAYKARLENTSNSWLLASATTLGQHSQTVLDTIAKAAEKRLRDTCAQVLAGMGDTLKSRLLGISDEMGAEDADDDLPPASSMHKK
jgi:hypothetical protein